MANEGRESRVLNAGPAKLTYCVSIPGNGPDEEPENLPRVPQVGRPRGVSDPSPWML